MRTTLTSTLLLLSSFSLTPVLSQETAEKTTEATLLQGQVADKVQVFDPESKDFVDFEFEQNPQYFILYYSASWCPSCRAIAADSVEFYNSEIANVPEVELIMINADQSKEDARKWAEQHSMPWPTFFKPDIQEAQLLIDNSPTGIPHMVLVDGEGKAIVKNSAARAKEQIKEAIKEIKEGKIPTPAESKPNAAKKIPADQIL